MCISNGFTPCHFFIYIYIYIESLTWARFLTWCINNISTYYRNKDQQRGHWVHADNLADVICLSACMPACLPACLPVRQFSTLCPLYYYQLPVTMCRDINLRTCVFTVKYWWHLPQESDSPCSILKAACVNAVMEYRVRLLLIGLVKVCLQLINSCSYLFLSLM